MFDAFIFNIGNHIYANYTYALMAVNVSLFMFGLIGFFPLSARPDDQSSVHFKAIGRRTCWTVILLIGGVLLTYSYVFEDRGEFNRELLPSTEALYFFGFSYLLGAGVTFLVLRLVVPQLLSLRERLKVSQTSDAVSDVRAEQSAAARTKNYNPRKYIRASDTKEPRYFLGLNGKNKPVYCSAEEWRGNHKIALGPTQVGKGVDIGVDLYQSIIGGNCTVMIDPKPDKHARSIMIDACREANRRLVEIDLTGTIQSEDYALLGSGNFREKRTRLQRLFKLEDKGTDADFYKVAERAKLSEILKNNENSFKGLFSAMSAHARNNQEKSVLKGSLERAKEVSEIVSVQDTGVNIRELIKENVCLYVRCSTSDRAVIGLSTALLEDVVQSVFATSPELGGFRKHHVFICHDEIRFTMNEYIATTLATIKGSNCHMSIAFQSFEDLKNIPDVSADRESIALSVKTNCTHKLIYRADDDRQAEWASLQTFMVNKNVVDRQQIDINAAGAEVFTGERSMNSKQEALFSPNKFAMLQPRVGVLCRPSQIATLIKTCWIDTDLSKTMPSPRGSETLSILEQTMKEKEDSDNDRINEKTGSSGNRTSNVAVVRPIKSVQPMQTLEVSELEVEEEVHSESQGDVIEGLKTGLMEEDVPQESFTGEPDVEEAVVDDSLAHLFGSEDSDDFKPGTTVVNKGVANEYKPAEEPSPAANTRARTKTQKAKKKSGKKTQKRAGGKTAQRPTRKKKRKTSSKSELEERIVESDEAISEGATELKAMLGIQD